MEVNFCQRRESYRLHLRQQHFIIRGLVAIKVPGVHAALIHDHFSAHQGVEDDDMNIICFGILVIGDAQAWELIQTFIEARFSGEERHIRLLAKVSAMEMEVQKCKSE